MQASITNSLARLVGAAFLYSALLAACDESRPVPQHTDARHDVLRPDARADIARSRDAQQNTLTVAPTSVTIQAGTTQMFVATVRHPDGTIEDVTAVAKWWSSDASIADVKHGLASAINPGSAAISVEFEQHKVSAYLTVVPFVPNPITSILISPSDPSIPIGGTIQFKATSSSGQDITAKVIWSSSSTVATVDATGEATGVAVGTTTISASIQAVVGTTHLTVVAKTCQPINVLPATSTIKVGAQQQLNAFCLTWNVTTQSSWSSSDINVVTVDPTGLATAIAGGTAQVTALFQGVAGQSNIIVQ